MVDKRLILSLHIDRLVQQKKINYDFNNLIAHLVIIMRCDSCKYWHDSSRDLLIITIPQRKDGKAAPSINVL